MIPVLDGILTLANKALDFIPDPNKRAEMQAELTKQQLAADLQLSQMQTDIDKQEAGVTGSTWFKVLVAGWRPALGWVCVLSFAWTYALQPFSTYFLTASGHPISLPSLDQTVLSKLLYGMLGLVGARSFEKYTDVESNR